MDTSSSFATFFSDKLNDNQRKAVTHSKGTLVICAGAGSGKTRVITARIAHLIMCENVLPTTILALTFTNKAGREMKERIKGFLDVHHTDTLPFIGTFHSYCLRLLKSNPEFFDPSFSLFDEDDQEKLLKMIFKKYGVDKKITPGRASAAISHIKNHALDVNTISDPFIRTLYTHYELEKSACRALDFDDLLLETLKLFKTHRAFKNRFHERIRHILVDEYQDTNHVQHQLLKYMALEQGALALDSVCVVGDEDQSIYSWRGATVSNILDFEQDFPQATTITIDQNYRSVMPILETANHVINHNAMRREKKLWSERAAQDRLLLLQCASEHHESEVIAHTIKLARQHHELRHLAILYRSHYQSRALEEAMIRHAIPYKIVGGIQFYERQEIKDLLAYLRLALNPFDRISFTRIINVPARGLGEKFFEMFMSTWDAWPKQTFRQIAEHLLIQGSLTRAKETALREFLTLYANLDITRATHCIETLVAQNQYLSYLRSAYEPDEARAKLENVQEFIQALSYFEQQGITSLADTLDEIALMQEISSRTNDDACIKLMTIHAAKGLEFACIFLVGLEDGVFPSNHTTFDAQLVEEERRLMYVALTRAQERIVMTYARFRTIYGQLTNQHASRFLKELPKHYVQHCDASAWTPRELNHRLSTWFSLSDIPNHHRASIEPPQAFTVQTRTQSPQWKRHQSITHPYFGAGIIEKVETRDHDKIVLTIKFKRGDTKKIDAAFLEQNDF